MITDDVDLMDPQIFSQGFPHGYFQALRERPGLYHATDHAGNPYWHVTRHADVSAVSRNPSLFRSSPTTMTSSRGQSSQLPIMPYIDPPEHTRLRRLVSKAFAPARMAALDPAVCRIVDDVLARVTTMGEFDLAEEIAARLPLLVLAELIGVPDGEREMVVGWARQAMNMNDPDYVTPSREAEWALFGQIFGYLRQLVDRRAAAPGDDTLSLLLSAEVRGERLSRDEITQFAITLMSAGSEATYCSITGGLLALHDHPGQLARLRADRALIPSAVDEILRWVTPVTHFARNVAADAEVAGQQVRAGERLVLWYSSANRDEAVFGDPGVFDVARDPNPHLSFGGGGPHACIGAALALIELRHLLEATVDRLTSLEFTGPPVRTKTNFMNSIKSMPARFA